jgi:hypothetical protein
MSNKHNVINSDTLARNDQVYITSVNFPFQMLLLHMPEIYIFFHFSIYAMDDWEQQGDLPCGAIVAVLAPKDLYWLAVTCTVTKPDCSRLYIKWLEEKKVTQRGRRTETCRYFTIDNTWEATFIWRDCVIADFSSTSFLDENDTCSIPHDALETVSVRAATYHQESQESTKTTKTSHYQAPTGEDGVCEETFEALKSKCAQPLMQVSQTTQLHFEATTSLINLQFVIVCNRFDYVNHRLKRNNGCSG